MVWLLALSSALAFEGDVVMLGNSYTFYNDLPALLDGALESGHEATVASLTAGGLRLPEHLARIDGGNTQWQSAFDGDRWSVVVLQDQSQVPGFPDGSPDKAASLEALAGLDAHAASAGAQTLFFLTWGRRSGDSGNTALYPTFSAMQDRLDAGYIAYRDRVSTADRAAWIAPVGPAFRLVHDEIVAGGGDPLRTDSTFWGLYTNDGSHPSPAGSWLAAGVFYASLTGCDPTELGTDLLPADEAAALSEIARRVVLEGEDGGLGLSYPWSAAPCGGVPANDSDEQVLDDAMVPGDDAAEPTRCGCRHGSASLLLFAPWLWRRRP